MRARRTIAGGQLPSGCFFGVLVGRGRPHDAHSPVQPRAHQRDVIAPFLDTHFSLEFLPGSGGGARCDQRRRAIARSALLLAAARSGSLPATRRVMKADGTGRSGTGTQQQHQNDGDDDIEAGRTFGQTDKQTGG